MFDVEGLTWCAHNPDLNPTEHLCGELEQILRCRPSRPGSVSDLTNLLLKKKNSQKFINTLLDSWWTAWNCRNCYWCKGSANIIQMDWECFLKFFVGSPSRLLTSSRETPNSRQYSKSYNHVFRWLEIYLFIYFSHKCWRHFVKVLHKADSDYLRFQFAKKILKVGCQIFFILRNSSIIAKISQAL